MNPALDYEYPVMGLPIDDIDEDKHALFHQSERSFFTQRQEKHHERQRSLPIRFELRRSESEIQLHEDERAAEFRDYCMYVRIVSGMASNSTLRSPDSPMDPSLANVIKTRNSYNNMSDGDPSEEQELSSTPILRNPLPYQKGMDLTFAPTPLLGNILPRHLPLIDNPAGRAPPAKSTPQGQSADEDIFDMDL